jgi:hypothetical protein
MELVRLLSSCVTATSPITVAESRVNTLVSVQQT